MSFSSVLKSVISICNSCLYTHTIYEADTHAQYIAKSLLLIFFIKFGINNLL